MGGEFFRMNSVLFVLIVILTLVSPGCADKHDYNTDLTNVMSDKTLSADERDQRVTEIQDKMAAQQAQQQWLPSEIIGGVFVVVLLGALSVKGLQIKPPPGTQARAKTQAPAQTAKAPGKPADKRGEKGAPPPSAAARPAAPWDAPAAPVIAPEVGQAAVDAVPEEQRGMSFFTSRPLSLENLVEIALVVGGRTVTVWGTQEEAEAVAAGRIPRIRALSTNGETRPWFGWPSYVPYRDYWAAQDADWVWRGGEVVASWLSLERLDPNLPGYLTPLVEDWGDEPASGASGSGLKKANILLRARRLPHLKVRTLRASLTPARTAPVPREPDIAPRRWRIKTGIYQPWVCHVRSRPKKSSKSAFA